MTETSLNTVEGIDKVLNMILSNWETQLGALRALLKETDSPAIESFYEGKIAAKDEDTALIRKLLLKLGACSESENATGLRPNSVKVEAQGREKPVLSGAAGSTPASPMKEWW